MNKSIPKLRFKGFTDSWKQQKLTDITKIYNGLTYHPKDKRKHGTLVLRSSNIQNGEIVHNDDVIVDNTIVNSPNVKPEDVIIVVRNGSRHLIGKHALVKFPMPKTVIGAFMNAFRCKNGYFLAALLGSNEFNKDVHESLGATINQLTKSDFKLMRFIIPFSLKEQRLIGRFFAKLDKLISLQQAKCSLLKKQKRGYLQKLFPKKNESVPRVRFNGFNDKWDIVRLGDIGQTKSGTGFPRKEQGGTKGVPFFKVSDMNLPGNNTLMNKSSNYVNNTQISKKHWRPIIPTNGALIFAKVGAALMKNRKRMITNKFLIDNNVMAYSFSNHWDKYFGLNYFNTIYLPKFAQTGALPSFNASSINSIKIKMPSLDEQRLIGRFFKRLDDNINLQNNKLHYLRKLKKAYLQKMFC